MSSGPSYLVVGIEGDFFGLEVARVSTVVEYRRPVPIPGRPLPLVGALNHHGELLPVAPLAVLLGRKPSIDPNRSAIVVLAWEDGVLGLLVERVHGFLTPLDRARPSHVLGRWDGPFLSQTLETDGRRVHALDLEALLADLARRIG